jgi:hypothetical protein
MKMWNNERIKIGKDKARSWKPKRSRSMKKEPAKVWSEHKES